MAELGQGSHGRLSRIFSEALQDCLLPLQSWFGEISEHFGIRSIHNGSLMSTPSDLNVCWFQPRGLVFEGVDSVCGLPQEPSSLCGCSFHLVSSI